VDLEAVSIGPRERGAAPLPMLKDRVRFGGPAVVGITKNYHPEDADLQAFIAGSSDRWALVHLGVTFDPGDPLLVGAKVKVHLSDDGNPQAVTAFSLLPLNTEDPYEETDSYSFGPNVTAGPVGISLGSVGKSTTHHGADTFAFGGPENSADPAWVYTPTPAHRLVGSSRMVMVVHLPLERAGKITVDLEAEVEQHGSPWNLFKKERVPLPVGAPGDAHFEVPF
jgi:hypothetical protein